MKNSTNYSTAPLISTDLTVRYAAIQSFWRDVHRLLNLNHPPEQTLGDLLSLAGLAFGADRIYTFAVTSDRKFASCTNEWTSRPGYALKKDLQNIEQKGLANWLKLFDDNSIISIEDTDNPSESLQRPSEKFRRDLIKSIYVFGFYDEGNLVGYLGLDYIAEKRTLDEISKDCLLQLASTLNLFILRHEVLELWNRTAAALPTSLFIKDADNDFRYTYANPQYKKIFGEDIVGKTDLEVFDLETGRNFHQQDLACMSSGTPYAENGPQPRRDGVKENYFSMVKFPVTTRMGRHRVAGFITDISSEYKLRQEAEQLLEKSKSAEKAKSLFLAAMSHEIRTPLNAIIGLVDELRHPDIPRETGLEYLSSVSTASRALLALINDVLDISKVEAGQIHMMPVETDLLLLLGECSSIFTESCRGKGLAYSCDVSPDLPILLVDTSRLRQILFNLIGNAIKFTSVGKIYVYAKFERGQNKTGTLTLEISDTGVGIAPEDQVKVFGLFEQASRMRGTAAANMGTGLGLCLCKRLAECMNGDISLKSEINVGSTFTVVLRDMPYLEHSEASDVVRNRKDRTIRINPLSLETRVLIVDDVPMNLKVLGIILRRMNIDFVAASNAQEALEKLRIANNGITHVLTDIWMPEMNGEELVRHIRANPRWSRLKIAAQTADVEAAGSFDTKLFDAVLSKPLTPEKIHAFLTRTGGG